jgi:hypothetical protein
VLAFATMRLYATVASSSIRDRGEASHPSEARPNGEIESRLAASGRNELIGSSIDINSSNEGEEVQQGRYEVQSGGGNEGVQGTGSGRNEISSSTDRESFGNADGVSPSPGAGAGTLPELLWELRVLLRAWLKVCVSGVC